MKPLHPILVHFPIALLTLSVGADLIGSVVDSDSLRHTGWWALCAAALGGLSAAAAGIYDMRRANLSEDVHHRVHRHMRVGIVLVSAIVALAIWRWTLYSSGGDLPAIYLGLAVLTLGLGAFQGWLGGELVYSDGVFVREGKAAAPADKDGEKSGHGSHDH